MNVVLDLLKLNSLTTNFYLSILATDEKKGAISIISYQVSSLVQTSRSAA
jgi:hypothetical protein